MIDKGGKKIVEYRYDAWGKQLSAVATANGTTTPLTVAQGLAALNPFRYRGYVYDPETECYYIRSRYYYPTWGRFLNADNILGSASKLFSYNLFAYCANNPVMKADPNGLSHQSAVDGGGSPEIFGPPEPLKMPNGGYATTKPEIIINIYNNTAVSTFTRVTYLTNQQAVELSRYIYEFDTGGAVLAGAGLIVGLPESASTALGLLGFAVFFANEREKDLLNRIDEVARTGQGVMICTYVHDTEFLSHVYPWAGPYVQMPPGENINNYEFVPNPY